MQPEHTHLSDGEIRTIIDAIDVRETLEHETVRRFETHLDACPACRSRAQALQDQAQRVQSRLALLSDPQAHPLKPTAARHRLAERLQIEQENLSTMKKLMNRISRPAWAAVALVAILAVAMAFPPVRAAASSFLQLFRVEQVRIIPVDLDSLPGEMENSAQLEALFSENVKIEENGETQEVASADEAAALAGYSLRLPAALDSQQEISYQPGGSATFTVDLELARAVMHEMGRDDLALPDSLDGAVVKADIPNSVVVQAGDCQVKERGNRDPDQEYSLEPGNCTTFMQMPSPVVSAPPEMDLEELGKIYLQVLGMSESEAALFAGNVDWTTTFVVPVPRGRADYKEVQVDGVPGTLIYDTGYRPVYSLLWVKDGMVYVLTGPGDEAKALELANSIQ